MEKEIRITVATPIECTEEQFTEWVEFHLGLIGGIKISNPLHEYDMVASDADIY